MQQTSQFHLNQWELTDRIRMEDFNGDNQKLETALASLAAADAAEQQARTAQDAAIRREAAAAAEAVPLVKLLEVPVTQEAAQVDVDVSQIDFTQYTEVWIVPILSQPITISICAATILRQTAISIRARTKTTCAAWR